MLSHKRESYILLVLLKGPHLFGGVSVFNCLFRNWGSKRINTKFSSAGILLTVLRVSSPGVSSGLGLCVLRCAVGLPKLASPMICCYAKQLLERVGRFTLHY